MTVARIDARFAKLKAEGRAAFIAYVMAGDPGIETSFDILKGLPAAGADLIELGFPFSDPMAEGVPIQKASLRSLKCGMTLAKTLGLVRRFREADQTTPLILMGYLNPVMSYGFARFAEDAAAAGVDGVIIVDCPPEEAGPLADALDETKVALIRLATPTTDDARLQVVVQRTSGFVYYVSVAGVTGANSAAATIFLQPFSGFARRLAFLSPSALASEPLNRRRLWPRLLTRRLSDPPSWTKLRRNWTEICPLTKAWLPRCWQKRLVSPSP